MHRAPEPTKDKAQKPSQDQAQDPKIPLIAAMVSKRDHNNHYCPSTVFFHVYRNTVLEPELQGINYGGAQVIS
jgi:hypothetical protein